MKTGHILSLVMGLIAVSVAAQANEMPKCNAAADKAARAKYAERLVNVQHNDCRTAGSSYGDDYVMCRIEGTDKNGIETAIGVTMPESCEGEAFSVFIDDSGIRWYK